MTPHLPEPFPSATGIVQDVLSGRRLFRAPSLDELVGMLDFRSFAAELSRLSNSAPHDEAAVQSLQD